MRGSFAAGIRKEQIALLVSVVLATTMLSAPVSTAHPTDRFDACGKPRGVQAHRCVGKVEVGTGVQVLLRAGLRPPHVGALAQVRRLEPHADSWERVGFVRVLEGGTIRWLWTPRDSDIHNYTAWRFRFAIPDHGWSDIVRVLVRSDEF